MTIGSSGALMATLLMQQQQQAPEGAPPPAPSGKGPMAPNGTAQDPNPEKLIPVTLFPNRGGGYGFGVTQDASAPEGYDHTINMTVRDGRTVSPSFAQAVVSQFRLLAAFKEGERAYCLPWQDGNNPPQPLVLIGTPAGPLLWQGGSGTIEQGNNSNWIAPGAFYDDGAGVPYFYAGQTLLDASGSQTLAPKLDAVDAGGTATSTSLTFSHTCSGTNRLLLVHIAQGGANAVSSVTYNGVALTLAGAVNNTNGNVHAELWYLLAPAVGTFNIVISLPAAATIYAFGSSWTGVNQTTPLGTAVTGTGTSTTPSVTVTSAVGDTVVDVLNAQQQPANLTPSTGQTSLYTGTLYVAGSSAAGAASVTMGWSAANGYAWAQVAVPLKPLAAAAQTVTVAGPLLRRSQAGVWTQNAVGVKGKFLAAAAGALWRVVNDYQVSKCPSGSDPFLLASWGTPIQVGTNDAPIVSIGNIDAAPIVGKADGIYAFDEPNTRFQNVFPVVFNQKNFPFMKPDGAGGLLTCTAQGDIIRIYRYGMIMSASPIKQKYPGRDTPRGIITDTVIDGDKVYAFLGASSRLTQQDGLTVLKTADMASFTDYTANVTDQSYQTNLPLSNFGANANDFILVGADSPFLGVQFVVGSPNAVHSTAGIFAGALAVSFSTGAGTWTSAIDDHLATVVDGTAAADVASVKPVPLARTGVLAWDPSVSLSSWVKDTYNGQTKYWARISSPSVTMTAGTTVVEMAVIPQRAGPGFTTTNYNQAENWDASGALSKVLVGTFRGTQIIWDDVYTLPDVSPDGKLCVAAMATKASQKSLVVATRQGIYQSPLPYLNEPSVADFPLLARDTAGNLAPVFYPSAVDFGGNYYALRYLHTLGRNFASADSQNVAFRWDDTQPWTVGTAVTGQEEGLWEWPDGTNYGRILTTALSIIPGQSTAPVGPSCVGFRAWVKPVVMPPGRAAQTARAVPEAT